MADKKPAPAPAAPVPGAQEPAEPSTQKPARTLSYGQANPKQGSGGRRSASKDD